tara:strand:+ start:859 stop:1299 length:441 start_codon:yes stop_codon:yes gene_type:complete
MKQVYNLLETIEQDKEAVAKLKKQLHHAESVLEAHTAALTRLTTIPKLPQPKVEKVDYSSAVETRECITPDNWRSLDIQEGDKVEIVVSGSENADKGDIYTIDALDYDDTCGFLGLEGNSWYWYNNDNQNNDEIYLIRTKEGSLND